MKPRHKPPKDAVKALKKAAREAFGFQRVGLRGTDENTSEAAKSAKESKIEAARKIPDGQQPLFISRTVSAKRCPRRPFGRGTVRGKPPERLPFTNL